MSGSHLAITTSASSTRSTPSRHALINVRSVLRVLCADGDTVGSSDNRGAAFVATATSKAVEGWSSSLARM
ncbi:MAG: hypothetical protein QGD90_03785 [Candidatus Hydrogenedentes bacterium]|nr:hypothetical protein [Candidatus Hydrogenedentota bacterium]